MLHYFLLINILFSHSTDSLFKSCFCYLHNLCNNYHFSTLSPPSPLSNVSASLTMITEWPSFYHNKPDAVFFSTQIILLNVVHVRPLNLKASSGSATDWVAVQNGPPDPTSSRLLYPFDCTLNVSLPCFSCPDNCPFSGLGQKMSLLPSGLCCLCSWKAISHISTYPFSYSFRSAWHLT